MKVKDIKNLPDETEIKINSVWDDEKNELTACDCDYNYNEETNEIYIKPKRISLTKKSEEEIRDYACRIIDLMENVLDENDITIPDEEREGNDDESRIYGLTYFALEDDIVSILDEI